MDLNFEQELQALLAKYPEIEDVSFTCKKTVKKGNYLPPKAERNFPMDDIVSIQAIAAAEMNKGF